MQKLMCVSLSIITIICGMFLMSACGTQDDGQAIVWEINTTDSIGGNAVEVLGEPKVIEAGDGAAVEFDGVDDALFVDSHPVAEMSEFTFEVIFNPYSGGLAEQRFIHMQETDSDESNRIMVETRLPGNGNWYLDTHIKTAGYPGITLIDSTMQHPCDAWYHIALVYDGNEFVNYVNSNREVSKPFSDYTSHKPGTTSLGVRQNKVYWFKGAMKTIRVTPRALEPSQFLKP